MKQNGYWVRASCARDQSRRGHRRAARQPYDEMLKNIDRRRRFRTAAKKYFDVNNYARFVLLPETKTTP